MSLVDLKGKEVFINFIDFFDKENNSLKFQSKCRIYDVDNGMIKLSSLNADESFAKWVNISLIGSISEK